MYINIFESKNFTFTSMGTTPEYCKNALFDGIKTHCKQYDVNPTELLKYAKEEFFPLKVTYKFTGICIRDGREIL